MAMTMPVDFSNGVTICMGASQYSGLLKQFYSILNL